MVKNTRLTRCIFESIDDRFRLIYGYMWKSVVLLLAVTIPCPVVFAAGEYFVYFASSVDGLYVSRFDPATAEVSEPKLAAPKVERVNFLEIHPNGNYLYACKRTQGAGGKPGGMVIAYAIDRGSGNLTKLNESDTRDGPAHITIDATGRIAVVSNYSGGSIAALPIRSDGSLGDISTFIEYEGSSIHPTRQTEPHPHSANFSIDNRFVVVADLGQDKLFVYRVAHAKGELTPNDPPFVKVAAGSGPRHMTFHPNGKFAYAINELASTVAALAYDADRGAFRELQTISTLPESFSETNTTAEVLVHPSGGVLYGSNRGHDSVAVFLVDEKSGRLTPVEHVSTQGQRPRNFRLDPTGSCLFAANQDSDTVVIFRVDPQTGRLTPTGRKLNVPKPMCVRFVKRD